VLSTAILFAPAALLAGCATGLTGPAVTPSQVIADAGSIINGLAATVTQINVASPGLIPAALLPQIQTYLTQAQAALASLSGSLPAQTSAVTLQQVEDDAQSVLTALAGVPLIPPPYSTAIQAAAILLPIVEVFVNQTLHTVAPTVAAPDPARANQARATLAAAIARAH